MRIHSPGYNKKKASARWGSRIGCLTSVRVPGWLLLLVVHTTPGGAAGWGWGHASPTTYPHIPSTTTATTTTTPG